VLYLAVLIPDSSVGLVTRQRAERCGDRGLDSRRGKGFFPSSTDIKPDSDAYRRTFPGIKRPGRELEQSPPYIAEVNNDWSCTSIPPIYLHGLDRADFFC